MYLKLLSKLKMCGLVLGLLCLTSLSLKAQTSLSAGDIAFTGYNADGNDSFSFILLTNISSGTVINFTDDGWTGSALTTTESRISWTSASAMSTFDVVTISGTFATSGSVASVLGTLAMAAGGDQIFAYQGTHASPTFIAAVHMNVESSSYTGPGGSGTLTTTTSNWDGGAGGVDESALIGTGLTDGVNAVWLHDAPNNGNWEIDNARAKCTALTGTVAQVRTKLNDPTNWDYDNSTPFAPTSPVCGSTSTTWNGSTWNNGAPDASTDAIIAGTIATGSFTCADLTINSGYGLVFNANQTVNVNGNVTNNGLGFIAAASTAVVNFASSGSLSGNAQTYSGQITVASGATLTTNNLLTLTAPSSSSYGSIGQSAGTISGNVTVQRFVPGKRAFRFMGHPFSSAVALTTLTDDIDITGTGGSANGFTNTQQNNPSAFWWDPTTGDNSTTGNNPGWTAFTNTNGSGANSWDQYELIRVMIRGQKGQGLSGGSYTPSDVTIDMTGTVNQGDQVVTLTKGSGSDFVACGNPFASGVQMNTVAKSGSIGANYYVWDATMAASGAYVTNAFTTSYVLPPFAALFTTASASGTLTFEEADKATGGSGLFKGTAAEQNWVELMISDSNTKWDRLMIHLDDNAMDVEDNQDAVKLYNPNLDFFTLSKDGQRLAIDVRPYSDGAAIPMGLTAYNRYNKYVIKTGNFDIPAGAKLFLHDKYLNTKTELGTGVEYWFDVTSDTASQGNNRFEINMVGKTTGIASTLNTPAKMQLLPNPAHNEVKVSFAQLEGTAQLRVMNLSGQVVFTSTVETSAGSVIVPLQDIPAGIYLVDLQSSNARFTEKLIKK